ncbi:MAG: monofunctional biosynthetic peptidoglycan transglycosylase [Chitinophagaceae bacterium]|nr:monofunctional biosynthetic peptidoglycan transglycosylase [Chitinophagaceae bacterium]
MAAANKKLLPRIWRIVKRVFIFLFFFHLFYLLLLKWVDPPITFTQLGSLFRGDGLKRDYVPFKEMSHYAKLAVVTSEDQLFPDHNGFDFKSIEKAMKHNRKSKSLRGASTISQQVAKNVFLWQGRSWIRKGLETYFTFMIELFWGKKRILEMYLNVVEMGRGIYGIQAAAKANFKKSAAQLTRQESALIASCLPNPKVYATKLKSRIGGPKYSWILHQMTNIQNDPDIQKLIQ